MIDCATGELGLLEVPTSDNGIEVLWAEIHQGVAKVLSVPVFANGLSRGSIVGTRQQGDRLRFLRVLKPSSGATIRVYSDPGTNASEVYRNRIIPGAQGVGVEIGPATLFDPEIVAIHLVVRTSLPSFAAYLDALVRHGEVRFWEPADPPMDGGSEEDDAPPKGLPWELIHQLPVDTSLTRATLS